MIFAKVTLKQQNSIFWERPRIQRLLNQLVTFLGTKLIHVTITKRTALLVYARIDKYNIIQNNIYLIMKQFIFKMKYRNIIIIPNFDVSQKFSNKRIKLKQKLHKRMIMLNLI